MLHILISFLFFNCLLFLIYKQYKKGKYYINKYDLVFYTLLLIAFGTYGGGEGDYLHYKKSVETFHSIFDIDVGGMEPQYYYLSYLVEGNYNLWRLVLFSIQFIGMSFLLLKSKLNTYPILLSFISICLVESVYGRAFWGIMFFFLGTYLLIEKKNPLYLIPIAICYVSHTQNLALLALLPLSLIDIKKWHIALFFVFAGILVSLLKDTFVSYIESGGIEGADYLNRRVETYSEGGGSGNFGNSFGERFIFFFRYIPIVVLFFSWLRIILNNRKKYLSFYIPYRRLINLSIGVVILSLMILIASLGSGTLFYRVLAMVLFPVSLLLPYMVNVKVIKRRSFELYLRLFIIVAEIGYFKDMYYAYVSGIQW